MSIFNLAQTHLGVSHPVMQFMIPHGYQINHVNSAKGKTLIEESFAVDFSFVPSQLRLLFKAWMNDYDIRHLSFPYQLHQLGLTLQDDLSFSGPLFEGLRVYRAIRSYVHSWLEECYPDEKTLSNDSKMLLFYEKLTKLPFSSTFGPQCSKKNLYRLLTTWLYVNIYLHFEHGDEGQELMKSRLCECPLQKIEKLSWKRKLGNNFST